MTAPERRARILVVEDVWLVAAMLMDMLGELGYEAVGPIGTLDEATDRARSERLDGAVLDVNLHGRPVFPVAEELHARSIPFVFITGYDDPSQLPEAFRDRPMVRKPYTIQQLRPVMRKVFPA